MISKIYKSKTSRRGFHSADPTRHNLSKPNAILRWTGKRYEVRNSFEIRTTLREAGFRWDPGFKCWFTEDPAIALKMAGYADKATSELLTASLPEEEA